MNIMKPNYLIVLLLVFTACSKTIDNTGNCTDGVTNQGEQGIDCGGPCPKACENCADGIMNQGETAVDCGGPCDPCFPSLSARINNGQWLSTSRNAQQTATGIRIFGTGQLQNFTLWYHGPQEEGTTLSGSGFTGEFRDESGNLYSSTSSGSITFTTFDTISRKVAGTFSFIGRDSVNAQSVLITSGVFTELNY